MCVQCAIITGDVSLDKGGAASTGPVDQSGCDAPGAGCLQRLISAQEQLQEKGKKRLFFTKHSSQDSGDVLGLYIVSPPCQAANDQIHFAAVWLLCPRPHSLTV